MRTHRVIRAAAAALSSFAVAAIIASCGENLPSGPERFVAQLKITVPHDTLVVGDSSTAQAQAFDEAGFAVSGLTFNWASADNNILGTATPSSGSADATSGRTRTFIGNRAGQSVVTLSLPDSRFTTTNATRTQTVVVAGVRVLSTHDSTLTAVNDTAFAFATSIVHQNSAPVNRASQGVRWLHLGTHVSLVGQGDTVRYISRSNGADTLIATHDFCLRGAKCADTVVARVSQILSMSLSTRSFLSWSFADSIAPIVRIADRRGTGLAGTSVKFIPLTAADSAILKVSTTIGTSNPTIGVVATPRLVSIGNGTAQALVVGLAPDGSTVIGTDTVTVTVRQVARRVAVEPLRASISVIDSIPFKPVARDSNGAVIVDATINVSAAGITLHGVWAGPDPINTPSSTASLTPVLSGVALPENNPLAPQLDVTVNPATLSLVAADTAVAGVTNRQISVTVLDSLAQPAIGVTVRFNASSGVDPAPVVTNSNGVASVSWTPPNVAGSYTLTGVRDTPSGLATLDDSAGRVVIRRSVEVIASTPNATKTSVAIDATTIAVNATATITVTVRDVFNNIVQTATPADFAIAANSGTISGTACTNGVCTATYKAPAAVPTGGTDALTVKIGTANVINSPITLTITP